MGLECYLPDWIASAFHIPKDNCGPRSSYKGPSSQQVDARQFYEGLMGKSPDEPISFPLYEKGPNGALTGRSMMKRTSIRELVKLDGDWADKTYRLQQVYDRMKRDGLVQETPLSDSDKNAMLRQDGRGRSIPIGPNQTRDPKLADPRGILRAPFSPEGRVILDPYNPTDPRGVPASYPNATDSMPFATLTPKVLNGDGITSDGIKRYYEDSITAIYGHLRARNVPMIFHPLNVALQAHIYPQRAYMSNLDNSSGQNNISAWASRNNDSDYLLQHTVLGYRFPEGDQTQGPIFGGESAWLWNASIDRRFPQTIGTGAILSRGAWDDKDSRLSWPIYTADALLELQRIVNVMRALLASGDAARDPKAAMVDMFAAQAVYHGAQLQAYRQVGRPYGTNVVGYREQLAREARERKASQRGDLGVPGYQSTGDDTADITMGCIGTVALAVKDGISKGSLTAGITSAVIRGLALLYTFLTGPDAEHNPYDYPIRMSGGKSPAYNGISVKNALELPPCFRV